ncbi:hypothetical protein Slin15195_G110410 [Septoria linicola]|uniref:Secreted protein n=1 Tax=Septoria linicola TaxID=215465 RepID=A0A9Q9EPH4_9PEZI|nr:hypothetical protein Slin14017_G108760 [Septoria linicola]USW57722.1 hypothetical protein Slin15195_G110410 [Septoria linicola]
MKLIFSLATLFMGTAFGLWNCQRPKILPNGRPDGTAGTCVGSQGDVGVLFCNFVSHSTETVADAG